MHKNVWMMGLLAQLLMLPLFTQADDEPVEDQASFQVSADQEVDNDRVLAILSVTAEDRSPARLAETVNRTMGWALGKLADDTRIKPKSGAYQTHPVYDDRKIVRWRARQELHIESGDVDYLSELIGVLQEKLQLQSLTFSVSEDKRREVESTLIEKSLAAFKARADLVARSLDASGWALMDVNVHTGGMQRPVPLQAESYAMSSRAKAVSAPALEQGTSRLSVQASGRIRLLRD